MADKEKGEEGGKLDQILAHLSADSAKMDAMAKRMDAMETMYGDGMKKLDAACLKMDAMEEKEKKADAARKDAEKEEEAKKADAAKADAARKDAEAKEEEEKKKADAARADAAGRFMTREEIAAMLPRPVAEEDRAKFVAIQAKWEPIAQAFGDSARRFMDGETHDQYRRHFANLYKKYSAAWKDVDLSAFADKALDTVEVQIIAAADAAARHPTDLPDNTLRMVTRVDQANRTHINFVGSEKAAWAPFCNPDRKGRINTRFERA